MSNDSCEQILVSEPGQQQHLSFSSSSAAAPTSTPRVVHDVGRSTNIRWQEGAVPTDVKEGLLKQRGCVLWFTGLSGSGKSTVACQLEHSLAAMGKVTALLDGDNIRHGLNSNLGFTPTDRAENIRRIGEVSKLFADTGLITLVSFISPYKKDREGVRARLMDRQFVEVYMKIPLEVCEQRDPKGLYKKARAGLLKGFTGIDDPYEEPDAAEVVLQACNPDGSKRSPDSMAAELLDYLKMEGYLA
ncbi:MAG: hypothetical protein WDW36_004338 [Sanguina aurantia]